MKKALSEDGPERDMNATRSDPAIFSRRGDSPDRPAAQESRKRIMSLSGR